MGSIKETLFERPYIVNSGAELIAAISAGMDPSQVGGGGGGMQAAMLPVGVPMTYCRATGVGKERGQIKPTSDWAKLGSTQMTIRVSLGSLSIHSASNVDR